MEFCVFSWSDMGQMLSLGKNVFSCGWWHIKVLQSSRGQLQDMILWCQNLARSIKHALSTGHLLTPIWRAIACLLFKSELDNRHLTLGTIVSLHHLPSAYLFFLRENNHSMFNLTPFGYVRATMKMMPCRFEFFPT